MCLKNKTFSMFQRLNKRTSSTVKYALFYSIPLPLNNFAGSPLDLIYIPLEGLLIVFNNIHFRKLHKDLDKAFIPSFLLE